jgi:hypothetical protein
VFHEIMILRNAHPDTDADLICLCFYVDNVLVPALPPSGQLPWFDKFLSPIGAPGSIYSDPTFETPFQTPISIVVIKK